MHSRLLPDLAAWGLDDLKELQMALTGLVEALESERKETGSGLAENDAEDFVDQPLQQQVRGHIETKYIKRGDKEYGPYLYLRYREEGRLRSKYLGKGKQQ